MPHSVVVVGVVSTSRFIGLHVRLHYVAVEAASPRPVQYYILSANITSFHYIRAAPAACLQADNGLLEDEWSAIPSTFGLYWPGHSAKTAILKAYYVLQAVDEGSARRYPFG